LNRRVVCPVNYIEVKVAIALCTAFVVDNFGTDAAEVDTLGRLVAIQEERRRSNKRRVGLRSISPEVTKRRVRRGEVKENLALATLWALLDK